MTDCILEAINSSIQAYITALTGRLGPSLALQVIGSPATSSGRAFAPLAWTSCHHSIRQCLERSGRFGPLARQLEIFLTASAVDRQLGRANTVLGMVPIKVLQCRQVLCVIALIMLLQCRYQFRLFS